MAATSSSAPSTSSEEQQQRVPDHDEHQVHPQSSLTMTDPDSPQIDSSAGPSPKDTPRALSPTVLGDHSSPDLLQIDQCLEKLHIQDPVNHLDPCPSDPSNVVSQPHPCCGPAESLDEFLLTALKNKQNRLFLLKLEREFCCYLESPSLQPLEFPWVNSYYRMMIHRSAIYFQLSRKVDPLNKQITLSKNSCSAIPVLRFSDLVEEEDEERTCQEEPVKPVKLLKRCPTRPTSACEPRPQCAVVDRRSISIEQRELDYAEARARIFKNESNVEGTEDTDGPSSQTSIKSTLVRRSSATSCSSSGTSMTEVSASSEAGSFTSSSSTGVTVSEHSQPLNYRAKPFQRSKATASWTSERNSIDKSSRQTFATDPTWTTCTGHDCQCATCSRYSYRPNEHYHQHQHPVQPSQYPMQPMPGWSASSHSQGLPYNPPPRRTPQSGNQSHEHPGGNFGHTQFAGGGPAPPPPPLSLGHAGPTTGYYHQTHPDCPAWCDAHQTCHDHQAIDNQHMVGQNHSWGQPGRGCFTGPGPVQVLPPPSPRHMAPMTLTVRPYPSANGYRPCRQGIDVFQQQQFYQQHPQQQQQQQQQHHHPSQPPHLVHPPRQHQHPYPSMSHSGNGQQNTFYADPQSQMHHYQLRPQQHLQHTQHREMHRGSRQPLHHHYSGRTGTVTHTQEVSSPIEIEPPTGASLHQQPPRVPRSTPPRTSFLQGSNHLQRIAHSRDGSGGSRNGLERGGCGGGGGGSGGSVVYDVDRRPPKSTELYDPYAGRSTPSGNHSTSPSSSSSSSPATLNAKMEKH